MWNLHQQLFLSRKNEWGGLYWNDTFLGSIVMRWNVLNGGENLISLSQFGAERQCLF